MRLYVQEEGRELKVLDIEGVEVTIGRSADNDVVIGDARSSRHHCRLSQTPQGVVLEDLKSSNGTVARGKPITRLLVEEGEEFLIGSTRFHYGSMGSQAVDEAGDTDGADEDSDPVLELESLDGVGDSSAESRDEPVLELESLLDDDDDDDEEEEEGSDEVEELDSDLLDDVEPAPSEAATVASTPAASRKALLGWLEIVEGASEKRVEISSLPFVVGRSSRCDLTLDDQRVSGKHAEITLRDDRPFVRDLGSKNGVIVGDKRCRKAILRHHSTIGLGTHVLQLHLAEPYLSADKAAAVRERPAGDESAPAARTLHVDLESIESSERWQRPVAVTSFVVIVALLAYFAIDMTSRILERPDVDPPNAANRVAMNWSFEDVPDDNAQPGSVPGWSVTGGSGTIRTTEEQAQPPGRLALELTSTATGEAVGDLCIVSQETLVTLGAQRRYFLQGHVASRTAFVAGLVVEWLKKSTGRERLVDRSFSAAARGSGASIEVAQFVDAPTGANTARIACWTFGGGIAQFDRVALTPADRPADGASEPDDASSSGGSGERVFTIESGDEPLVVTLDPRGVFSLRRSSRVQIPAFWAGLSLERDPLAFGARLSEVDTRPAKSGGVTLRSSVPDFPDRDWIELRTEAVSDGSRTTANWQLGAAGGAEPDAASSLVVHLASTHGSQRVVAHGVRNSATMSFDEAAEGSFVEFVFGEDSSRTSLEFSTDVSVHAMDHPVLEGTRILELRPVAVTRTLSLTISHGSRREARTARHLLAEADREFQASRPAAALAHLDEVIDSYAEQTAETKRAEARKAAWRREADGVARDLRGAVEAFATSPSRAVWESLDSRARLLVERYGDTPVGAMFRSILSDLQSRWKTHAGGEEARLQRDLLAKAQKDFAAGQLGLAELWISFLKRESKDEALLRDAENLLSRIRTRRETQRKILIGS